MNCRGEATRKKIVDEYNIIPIAYVKLLNGQTKHSDAESEIKDKYYIFECIHKITGGIDVIQCGMGAARHFLKLLNHDPLPLFNPLCETSHSVSKRKIVDVHESNNTKVKWNPMAEQLFNAIMILIIDWDAKPSTTLFELKKIAEKYKYCNPYLVRIIGVNKIISKDNRGRTMTQIINELSIKNNIKDYKFNLLNAELEIAGIKSYF